MGGLTDYITQCPWEHIFISWYTLVGDAYQGILRRTGRLRQRGPEPTFSDSEVITVVLITEILLRGNEEICLAFIRQYHTDLFPRLLEDTSFNRWRRVLMRMTDAIRRYLIQLITDVQVAPSQTHDVQLMVPSLRNQAGRRIKVDKVIADIVVK